MTNPANIRSKLLIAAAISVFLVGCKSTPIQDGASVEDKSATASSADSSDVKGAVIDGSGASGSANELNDPNSILSKRNIYFDYNSDTIRAEYRPNVEAHATYLNAHTATKMTLQGNADERGTREYNLSLAQRRAVAVKKALNILGVSDSQIETVSYGEENANPNCASEDCFAQDRRVEIVYPNE